MQSVTTVIYWTSVPICSISPLLHVHWSTAMKSMSSTEISSPKIFLSVWRYDTLICMTHDHNWNIITAISYTFCEGNWCTYRIWVSLPHQLISFWTQIWLLMPVLCLRSWHSQWPFFLEFWHLFRWTGGAKDCRLRVVCAHLQQAPDTLWHTRLSPTWNGCVL